MNRQIGVYLLTVCFVSGCAIFTFDITEDPRTKDIIGKCLELKKDAFLVDWFCRERKPSVACYQIQVVGGVLDAHGRKETRLPANYSTYDVDKNAWNNEHVDHLLFGLITARGIEIAGKVPKGTKIKISRAIDMARGDMGRCLVLYAVPVGGDGGIEYEIPSCGGYHGSPIWTNYNWIWSKEYNSRAPKREGPLMNEDVVQACAD